MRLDPITNTLLEAGRQEIEGKGNSGIYTPHKGHHQHTHTHRKTLYLTHSCPDYHERDLLLHDHSQDGSDDIQSDRQTQGRVTSYFHSWLLTNGTSGARPNQMRSFTSAGIEPVAYCRLQIEKKTNTRNLENDEQVKRVQDG